jgi:hypothetical protein
MERPDPEDKGVLLRPVRSPHGSAEMEVVRPGRTIGDPGQHHCADHATFHADCVVCKRACANFQPYPMRKTKPVARSFGYTDDLTEEKIRALDPKPGNLYADDPEFSLSLSVVRFLLRLIWPFRF